MPRTLDYSDYLSLNRIPECQHPVIDADDKWSYGAEHFFIVAHQCSELWLKQVLLDISVATSEMDDSDGSLELACDHLCRAGAALDMIATQVKILLRMHASDFARFRGGLHDASGAQSVQFRLLFTKLGLPQGQSSLMEAFLGAVGRSRRTLKQVYQRGVGGGVLFRLAEAMAEIAQATWAWQSEHVRAAQHLLGTANGTGGSSGVDYLARRMALAFPELWAAKATLHGPRTA